MTSRGDQLLLRYRPFVAAGVIAAHASFLDAGFRQRDLRFFIELFTNWIESSLEESAIPVRNTQVLRFLDSLCADGFTSRSTRGRTPRYRLTRVGVLEMAAQVVRPARDVHMQRFFFIHTFIRSYAPKIEQLAAQQGAAFPVGLRLELNALFDVRALVEREIRGVEREIKKLEGRINDATQASVLMRRRLREGVPFETALHEVESRFPYELNSQKPLRELILEVPPDMRRWELEEGNQLRAEQLWKPYQGVLRSYLRELQRLGVPQSK